MNADPLLPDNYKKDAAKPEGRKTVVMYCIPNNPETVKAREFFKRNGVIVDERDVTTNARWAEHVLRNAGNAIEPFIETGGNSLKGFNPLVQARLSELLNL
ncbi:hypothetical protein AUJ14_03415 [Candidatus Micrarchaeota archaeon CG1_02_55_22]|nr:MAG: hypothetical protein AUJ14_03415 [Candidatus Micrarchaeota archaeon CG1_02_55_22]